MVKLTFSLNFLSEQPRDKLQFLPTSPQWNYLVLELFQYLHQRWPPECKFGVIPTPYTVQYWVDQSAINLIMTDY